jgi:acylphosphatase
MKQLHLIISGRVQGVGYRYSAQIKAHELVLKGWVKNLPNGNVEVLAQGDETSLHELLQWAHKGPALARVNHIEIKWSDSQDLFESFAITS